MSERVEGTIILDGLIEGKLPDEPGAEDRIRQWVSFAASRNLRFSLEVEGASFSVLALKKTISVEDLQPGPTEQILDVLGELLRIFPDESRRTLLSTLRSVEYGPGTEKQSLYVITSGGSVDVRQRTVEVETTAPPRKLTTRQKVRLAAIGVGVALLVLAVSAIFVDYRSLLSSLVEKARPFDVNELAVETGTFAPYMTVSEKKLSGDRSAILLTFKRTEAFPVDEAQCRKLLSQADLPLAARLTIEALARGYVRCELFDKESKFISYAWLRIVALRDDKTLQVGVPISRNRPPLRITVTY